MLSSMRRIIFLHNIYSKMGWEHVIPQLVLKIGEASKAFKKLAEISIQGTGQETRTFAY